MVSEQNASSSITPQVLEDLRALAAVTAARREQRVDAGAVVLERGGLSFDFDADGHVLSFRDLQCSDNACCLSCALCILVRHFVSHAFILTLFFVCCTHLPMLLYCCHCLACVPVFGRARCVFPWLSDIRFMFAFVPGMLVLCPLCLSMFAGSSLCFCLL